MYIPGTQYFWSASTLYTRTSIIGYVGLVAWVHVRQVCARTWFCFQMFAFQVRWSCICYKKTFCCLSSPAAAQTVDHNNNCTSWFFSINNADLKWSRCLGFRLDCVWPPHYAHWTRALKRLRICSSITREMWFRVGLDCRCCPQVESTQRDLQPCHARIICQALRAVSGSVRYARSLRACKRSWLPVQYLPNRPFARSTTTSRKTIPTPQAFRYLSGTY